MSDIAKERDEIRRLLNSANPIDRLTALGRNRTGAGGTCVFVASEDISRLLRHDSDARVRAEAIKSCIFDYGVLTTFEDLSHAMQNDSDSEIRLSAAKALAHGSGSIIGEQGPPVVLTRQASLREKCLEVLRSAEPGDKNATCSRLCLSDLSALKDVVAYLSGRLPDDRSEDGHFVYYTLERLPDIYSQVGMLQKWKLKGVLKTIAQGFNSTYSSVAKKSLARL